ncbi:Phage-related tail fibre protein [Bradyrhizobium sp. NFR13]|uniref:hypothetical protein n=1 Tax=Bradyrhizobium sp. NFR13 TaxID=1566285 RepID=UPI0008EE6FD8|nr:hypothetical protein [Bradyrhizobium sp. NFR13]SFM29627.1 Phage-related tail fibre protein [Bradyrhizobium sp. NFR13]
MSYPTKYDRQFDYVSYQNSNPTRPLPATKVNADLNFVQQSTKEIVDFLKTSIRADGKIMNAAVGRDQLDPSVNLGFTPPTAWEAGVLYTASTSTVFYGDAFYSALVTHTSAGSFEPSKWSLIADFQVIADEAALAAIDSNPNLHAISLLTSAADKGIVFTGAGTAMTFDLSAFSRTLLDDMTAGGMLTTLGVSAFAQTVLDDADGPTALATLGALPKAGGTMTGALTLAADPASALQAATKQYVDAVAQGLDTKPSVIAATTANITLSAPQTIDGIAVIAGDRVLVKNQSTASQNGIYVVAAGAWARATDADAWAELPGAFVFVEKGTVNADCGFVCTVDAGGTIGSTNVTFTQFSGAGTYSATGGVTLTGTQFSITTNGITNAMRAQMAAWTLKGNATGSLANEADFTIGGLANKTTPAGSDLVLIQDQAASGALKYSTLTQVIGAVASGVSSVGGISGAVGLGPGLVASGSNIQTAASIAGRNRVINGQFAINERGASGGVIDNAYSADRWRMIGEFASATVFADNFNAAGGNVPAGTCQFTGTTDKGGFVQIIEGRECKDLRSKAVTLSMLMSVSNARLGNMKIGIAQWGGTEDATTGDPVATWGADGVTPTLATNWSWANTPANLGVTTSSAPYSVSATLNGTFNNLAVVIWNDEESYAAGDNFNVTNGQLEEGGVATPYEFIPIAVLRRQCLRYLPVAGGASGDVIGSGDVFGTTIARVGIRWVEPPRIPPSGVTVQNLGNFTLISGSAVNNAATGISLSGQGPTGGQLNCTTGVALTNAAAAYLTTSNANARLLFVGCEL